MWWILCVTDCPFLSIVAPLTDGELDRNEGEHPVGVVLESG
jgi:hypothetical protein